LRLVGLLLGFNNIANNNTATGPAALMNNTSGFGNTANGSTALASSTTGNYNTAVGVGSLFNDTAGSGHTALGRDALSSNVTGNNNTGVGRRRSLAALPAKAMLRSVAGHSPTVLLAILTSP
jgi:hypothetical protein